ncbi:hypothetical protein FB475_6716 [Kribbella jejuensis]|uniref:Uncharacterized protein n=1 Tax=Kribbella jejuensis TaxID=236068 RepID=A0A542D9I4_9ACTN|nr:hypothetical protein FB475_6716 [Kribbella jejuensis]
MRQPLLCRRHHVDVHNDRWTITFTNGHPQVARPTWADPPPLTHPRTASGSTLRPPSTPGVLTSAGCPGASTSATARSALGSARSESPHGDPWGDSGAAYSSARKTTPVTAPCNESAGLEPARSETTRPLAGPSAGPHADRTALAPAQPTSSEPDSAQSISALFEAGQRAVSGALETGERTSRWRGNTATYAEAARFAVWDGNRATDPSAGPPSFATT